MRPTYYVAQITQLKELVCDIVSALCSAFKKWVKQKADKARWSFFWNRPDLLLSTSAERCFAAYLLDLHAVLLFFYIRTPRWVLINLALHTKVHCSVFILKATEWRYQKFDRNRYRDFFSDTKFSETDTETFFPIPNFPKPKPIPSKNWQKFRNREVSKPKCQSLRSFYYLVLSRELSLFHYFSIKA